MYAVFGVANMLDASAVLDAGLTTLDALRR